MNRRCSFCAAALVLLVAALSAIPSAALPLGLRLTQQAAIAANSGPTARDYVQDGLVAMWDGIENAGWGVHDPNATNWVDLVNGRFARIDWSRRWWEAATPCRIGDLISYTDAGTNYTAQLMWKDNCLYGERYPQRTNTTDGKMQLFVSVGYNPVPYAECENATIEVVSNGYMPATVSQGTYRYYTALGWFGHYWGNLYDGLRGSYITTNPKLRFNYLDGRIVNQTQVWWGTNQTLTCYVDGVKSHDATCSRYASVETSDLKLLTTGGERPWHQATYCTRFYNRALTAEEIAHNYEIDKARFGSGNE